MNPSLVTEYKDLRYLILGPMGAMQNMEVTFHLNTIFSTVAVTFSLSMTLKNESNKWGYQVLTFVTLSKT